MNIKPVIGITMGDPAGIGAELVCKAAAAGFFKSSAIPVIVGEEALLLRGMRHSGTKFEYRVVGSVEEAAKGGPIALLPCGNLDIGQVKWGRRQRRTGGTRGISWRNASGCARPGRWTASALRRSTRRR